MVSWLPSIRVGPSRYFSVFSWLQANSGWSATSVTLVSQVNSANAAWQASVGCQSMRLVRRDVPVPSGATHAWSDGAGGAVGSAGIGALLPVLLGSWARG